MQGQLAQRIGSRVWFPGELVLRNSVQNSPCRSCFVLHFRQDRVYHFHVGSYSLSSNETCSRPARSIRPRTLTFRRSAPRRRCKMDTSALPIAARPLHANELLLLSS